jgi:hypothetical protein
MSVTSARIVPASAVVLFVPVAWDAAGLAGGVAAQQSPVGLSHAVLLMLNMYAAMHAFCLICVM